MKSSNSEMNILVTWEQDSSTWKGWRERELSITRSSEKPNWENWTSISSSIVSVLWKAQLIQQKTVIILLNTHQEKSIRTFPYSITSISSIQFSRSIVSDSLRPQESQHARPPCPSPTPGVHSDSRPSSLWRHPAISSSVVPFCSWPQSLPASESFPTSQLFTWGGQSTGVSALASFLPKKS